ncbi:hypothetical protein [Tranquillimonas alkanivorans]|uniref:Uncharacterized protein n=1 Tax=Tranquillimonas alkanivorans TaxID=441119 RepID=A0A1I5PCG8_9RHOB|nr:hypothetical protein [Tranquillimonas alkanivorans]SFP31597.1 hypothetical protein SAMN04488047_10527 [Tranquillimonas alkanivorans]
MAVEADRYVNSELSDKLLALVQSYLLLCVVVFVLWATLPPAWALALTVLAHLFLNLVFLSLTCLSNMLSNDRVLSLGQAGALMHFASAEREGAFRARVEQSFSAGDAMLREARRAGPTAAGYPELESEHGRRALWRGAAGLLAEFALLAIVSAAGLYSAPLLGSLLTGFESWVISLR